MHSWNKKKKIFSRKKLTERFRIHQYVYKKYFISLLIYKIQVGMKLNKVNLSIILIFLKCMVNNLGEKIFRLFGILIFQNFRDKSNIVV